MMTERSLRLLLGAVLVVVLGLIGYTVWSNHIDPIAYGTVTDKAHTPGHFTTYDCDSDPNNGYQPCQRWQPPTWSIRVDGVRESGRQAHAWQSVSQEVHDLVRIGTRWERGSRPLR